MPSVDNLSWIAIGTTVVINAGTLWNQSRLARQYRNWNLYITEKHKIYPALWEKLYTTGSLAMNLIQNPSEREVAARWEQYNRQRKYRLGNWADNKDEALKHYKAGLLSQFEPKARDVRKYFLESQLYMSDSVQESVDDLTEQLMGLVQQQQGSPHQTWAESVLTAKLNEIKNQLRLELSQPGFMAKMCDILRAKVPAFSREQKKPPIL